MSLSDLKASLEGNWAKLDENGDGKIDAEELIDAFDTDGNGVLDKEEVTMLSKQLSAQMEYNNALLEHLQSLENSQLESQRDMKKKEHALKLAVSVSNAARAEANELRRKLAVATELCEEMTKQARDGKVASDSKQRQIDMQKKNVEETKALYENAVKEKQVFESKWVSTCKELNNIKEEFRREKNILEDHVGHLKSNNENLLKDNNDVRHRLGEATEKNTEYQKLHWQLAQEVKEANERLSIEANSREDSEVRSKEYESQLFKVKEALKERDAKIREEDINQGYLKEENKSLREQQKRIEGELKLRENRLVELNREYKDTVDENKALKNELEQVGNDLLTQAKQRATEQERWASKLAKAQEQLARVTEDARKEVQNNAHQAQKMAQEHMQARKESEEQYIVLQAEHALLHDLLKDMQNDARERNSQHEAEKNAFNDKQAQYNSKLLNERREFEETLSAKTDEIKRARDENRALRQEMLTRGTRYVQMLTQIQGVIRQMAQEGKHAKEEIADIQVEFGTLVKYVHTLARKHSAPLEAWYTEVEGSFEGLIAQNSELRKDLEDTKDDLRRADLDKEEERTKNLMFEDEVDRLKHEIHVKESELDNHFKQSKDKIDAKNEEINRNNQDIKILEKKVKDVQNQSDQLSATNRRLREEANRSQKQIADLQDQQSQKNQAAEDRFAQLENECKNLNNDKDTLQKNREEFLRTIKEKEREIQRFISKIQHQENLIDSMKQELIAADNKSRDQLKSFKASNEILNAQVSKFQEAYKTSASRVDNLQETNNQLRGELNELYHSQGIKVQPEGA